MTMSKSETGRSSGVLLVCFASVETREELLTAVKKSGLQKYELVEIVTDDTLTDSKLHDLLNHSHYSIIILMKFAGAQFAPGWGKELLKIHRQNKEYGVLGYCGTRYIDESGHLFTVQSELVSTRPSTLRPWWKRLRRPRVVVKGVVAVDWPVLLVEKDTVNFPLQLSQLDIRSFAVHLSFQCYCSGQQVGVIDSCKFPPLTRGSNEEFSTDVKELFAKENRKDLPCLLEIPQANKVSSEPVVSIVVPVYNYGLRLVPMFRSIFQQTYRELEIVVVDDGSTDIYVKEKLNILENAGYIKLITQSNQGPSAARNRGIAESNGKYILPLDADDEIMPEYVAKCVAILENNEKISPVYCDTIHIGEMDLIEQRPEWSRELLISGPFIVNCSMFRREAFIDAGGYDSDLQGWEDYDLWLRMMLKGYEGVRLPEPLFTYFHHESDGTVSTKANIDQEKLHHKILRKNGLLDG